MNAKHPLPRVQPLLSRGDHTHKNPHESQDIVPSFWN